MQNTILIIEDDKNIAELVKLYCNKEGFRAIIALDGKEGLDLAKKANPACIILDLMLPEIGGIDILKELRARGNTPVIILTAKEEEVEKILGLEMGADDYITKPFSPNELMARIKAVLRRTKHGATKTTDIIEIQDLQIDPEKFEVKKGTKKITLSASEFKLLRILAGSPGRVFSREQLMNELYENNAKTVFDRTMDVHIKNLRKKLNDNPKKPTYIESVFSIGYKFKEE